MREVCRLLDEVEGLHLALESDGYTVAGAAGQVRVHPAVTEVRQHRQTLGRLLAQLALPDPDGQALLTPTEARARRAPSSVDGVPVLPRELAEPPRTAQANRDRGVWLREHGIDPGDWCAVYEVLKASRAVYGIPMALDRARARSEATTAKRSDLNE